MEIEEALLRFKKQKANAAARGIAWRLTFHQWFDWWGEDLDHRGAGHDKLMMCRTADRGAYELGNIYKGYPKDNAATMGRMVRLRNTQRAHAALQAVLNVDPGTAPSKDRIMTDDEAYIQRTMGLYSSLRVSQDYFAADKRR